MCIRDRNNMSLKQISFSRSGFTYDVSMQKSILLFNTEKNLSAVIITFCEVCQVVFLNDSFNNHISESKSWIVSKICKQLYLSLIHISEPTRLGMISYAVFCLKKKNKIQTRKKKMCLSLT
eukprot:TRINITY_DN9025_c0_g1_i2.p1 TRINITY_DN9025_c0_g1~~TRINITY_DN9025_c0_g1_i2.p1  ORF type:complete len:121 (+),score=12.61 TRINITY_DN9025_c0_g1_i2:179-541(+)